MGSFLGSCVGGVIGGIAGGAAGSLASPGAGTVGGSAAGAVAGGRAGGVIGAAAGAAAGNAAGEALCPEQCPPCTPYEVGRIGYVGPRISQHGTDGARNNGGIGVVHYKLYAVVQDKRDCKCQWMHTKRIKSVYGHHVYAILPNAIDLNGKGEPPKYP